VTLRINPAQRDLKRACHLLRLLVRGNCKAVTITDGSSDMVSLYKPVTRLSHVENVLVCVPGVHAVNQTAQSLVYRLAKSLDYTLPPEVAANLPQWIIDAAQRNHTAAQQNLHEVLDAETCRSRLEAIPLTVQRPGLESLRISVHGLGYGPR
jgi:hypothetical protein